MWQSFVDLGFLPSCSESWPEGGIFITMFQERYLIRGQCPSQAWPRAEATQEAAALGGWSLAVPESGWGRRGHSAFELPSELCCFKFIQAHPLCSSHPRSSSRHGSDKNFGGKVWLCFLSWVAVCGHAGAAPCIPLLVWEEALECFERDTLCSWSLRAKCNVCINLWCRQVLLPCRKVSRTRIKALGNENSNKYFNNFDSNDSLGL